MLSNQIRAVFAGRFCLGEGEEEEEREKSNERRVNRVDTFSRDERFRGRGNSSPNFRDKSFAGEERSFGEIREIGRFSNGKVVAASSPRDNPSFRGSASRLRSTP